MMSVQKIWVECARITGLVVSFSFWVTIMLHCVESSQVAHVNQFHVAPMQGYTNFAMRQFFRELSPTAILWTEMEKVPDILSADTPALVSRFGTPGHKDVVLQLGGNDPATLRKCLDHISRQGYSFSEINLNCGCPSIESGGAATFGASLMTKPSLTRDLMAAIKDSTEGDTRVSLKCRTSVYNTIQEMENDNVKEASYTRLCEYVAQAQLGGMSHLVLHARPAILSGLSPVRNRQVPPIDYTTVHDIAKKFESDLSVTLNGGIVGVRQLCDRMEESEDMNSPVSSFMAGRWVLRRPLDLAIVDSGTICEIESSIREKSLHHQQSSSCVNAIASYSKFVIESVQSTSSEVHPSLADLCLPLFILSEQIREDYEGSEGNPSSVWMSYETMEIIYDATCILVAELEDVCRVKSSKFSSHAIEFNKLSSSIKALVGKKVVNKWKRNRAEL